MAAQVARLSATATSHMILIEDCWMPECSQVRASRKHRNQLEAADLKARVGSIRRSGICNLDNDYLVRGSDRLVRSIEE